MSHLSFIHAPFREDRGKRTNISHVPAYQKEWDYLKDNRPEPEKKTYPIGQSCGRESKFKVGFFRRPYHRILGSTEGDRAHEAERAEQKHLRNQHRSVVLNNTLNRNGNILLPQSTEEKLFTSKKHFPTRSQEVETENHARQKIGASRFHVVLTSREEQQRRDKNLRNLAVTHTTSVIGYGRSDLSSQGVMDNFRDASYSAQDEIKPRTKNTQKTHSQIVFNDGSDGWHSKTLAANKQSTHNNINHRQSAPAPRLKNNQTSSELYSVFSYPQVTQHPLVKSQPSTTSASS